MKKRPADTSNIGITPRLSPKVRANPISLRRIDSGNSPKDRVRLVERFAPIASGYPEIRGTEE